MEVVIEVAGLVQLPTVAVTEIVPPVAPGVNDILLVVEVPVHPVGAVQVYAVAPATEAAVYVSAVPVTTTSAPLMFAGAAGIGLTVTIIVLE